MHNCKTIYQVRHILTKDGFYLWVSPENLQVDADCNSLYSSGHCLYCIACISTSISFTHREYIYYFINVVRRPTYDDSNHG